MVAYRVGAFLVLILFAVTFMIVFSLYMRHRSLQLFHRERMAALEKGATVPAGYALEPWSPRIYLLRGLIWSFAGGALIICLLGIVVSTQRSESQEAMLFRAKSLSQSLNISTEEAKQIVERDSRSKGISSGVALLGLIPLAVGLAYLVFYYTGDWRRESTSSTIRQ